MPIVIQILLTAVALWVSTIIPGIDLTGGSWWEQALTLLGVAVIFGLINIFIKPLVKIFGCVFYIVTLGLIGFVVNALLFWLTGWLSQELGLPFEVTGFWPAFWGAIIVTLVSWILSVLFDRVGQESD